MKIIVTLFLYLVSLVSYAEEYESIQLIAMPPEVSQVVSETFIKHQFLNQTSLTELTSIGINQVFLQPDSAGFVTVKFGVKGNFPLNTLEALPDGKLLHVKIDNDVMAFFFHNIPDIHITRITQDLKHLRIQKTSLLQLFRPVNSALADDDCSLPVEVLKQDGVQVMKNAGASVVSSALLSCMNGAEGAVKDRFDMMSAYQNMKESAVEFWNAPTKKIGQYYHAVSGAVTGFLNFTYLIGETLLRPETGLPKIKQKLGAAGETFAQVLSMISRFPAELGVHIACSVISGIGVDAFIGALTGGLGAAKLLLTLKKLNNAFDVLGKLKHLMSRLKLSKLEDLGLSVESLKKLFQKMLNGTLDMKKFEIFGRSLESESSLARTFAIQGMQCSF